MNYHYYLNLEDDYVVAFIDILGFSSMIKENSEVNSETNGFIFNFDVFSKNILEKYNKEYQEENELFFIFVSDSFFIATPKEKFNYLLTEINYIAKELFAFNLAFRGGVALGKAHLKNNIWGPAVVEAVNLEKIADKPCIIMRKDLLNQVNIDEKNKTFFRKINISKNNNSEEYVYYNFFASYFDEISNNLNILIPTTFDVFTKVIESNFNKLKKSSEFTHVGNKAALKWKFLASELYEVLNDYEKILDIIMDEAINKATGEHKRCYRASTIRGRLLPIINDNMEEFHNGQTQNAHA